MASSLDPLTTLSSEVTLDSPSPQHSRPASLKVPEIDEPTISHGLAEAKAHQLKETSGSAGVILRNDEARDSDAAFQPHILGMSKEDVWLVLRRFNYLVFRLKAAEKCPLSDLDVVAAEHRETSPQQLQAQFARLYMTVIIGLFAFYKHMARLRSWSEPHRTSKFLLLYSVAWIANLLAPTIFLFLVVLVSFPASRRLCFPPVPPSIVDAATGGVQKPPAGVMATETTITGAPENHKGEAVEQEAHSFITSFSKASTNLNICQSKCVATNNSSLS